jgi:hypothetical protein
MSRRLWASLGIVVLVGVVGSVVIYNGRTGPGALWLDGVPDPSSDQVAVFVWGGCDDDVEIRSISIEETPDAVVVDLRIRWPIGIGAPACGSFEGLPYQLQLENSLADRTVYILNTDASTWEVQPSPFAG